VNEGFGFRVPGKRSDFGESLIVFIDAMSVNKIVFEGMRVYGDLKIKNANSEENRVWRESLSAEKSA
jgi:hypothetical protein